ncbi:MAG: hypothetical protein HFF64_09340 [Oscillospiraceae bacterium]|nr:hypothetical protein [Oscillospiraceae bacterium]
MANNVKPAGTEKKPGVWKSFAVLMTSVKVPWVWVGLATLVSLFGAQLSLIIPDATAQVAAGDVSMGAILFMVGCMFLSALETSVRQIFGRIASSKTEMNFQKLMLKKNLSLPMPFFDKNMANRLITRTTSDSTLIAEFFGWSVPFIPAAFYKLVGVIIILGQYNWRLLALEAIMLPVIFLVTFLSGRVGFTWNNRIQGKVMKKTLLENPHACQVLMRPSHTAGQEKQAEETARLQAARNGWNGEELENLRQRQAQIEAWQNTPDPPEALASIPMLRLEEIPAEPEKLPLEETSANGLPVLRHTLPTGGITYLNVYFALDDLPAEQLTQAAFLCMLLGSLDTAGHDMDALQKARRSLFGDLQFSVEAYKVYALLCQHRAAFAEQIAMAGHSFAMGRVSACCTAAGAAGEYAGGIACYRWLKELEENFRERFPALQEELAALAARIFCRRRLTVSMTASDGKTEGVITGILANRLPDGAYSRQEASLLRPWTRRREGIVIPGDVSFALVGGVFPEACRGVAKVMGRAVSLTHLWNAVRVQGGAYGAGMVVDGAGMVGCYSYRDPSAARTLDCFRRTAGFLENLGELDMTSFILGSVAESEPLLTPRMKGKTADARHWHGITYGVLCRIRREMLSAAAEKLADLAEPVRAALDGGPVCVLGPRRQLDDCAGELDVVEVL